MLKRITCNCYSSASSENSRSTLFRHVEKSRDQPTTSHVPDFLSGSHPMIILSNHYLHDRTHQTIHSVRKVIPLSTDNLSLQRDFSQPFVVYSFTYVLEFQSSPLPDLLKVRKPPHFSIPPFLFFCQMSPGLVISCRTYFRSRLDV